MKTQTQTQTQTQEQVASSAVGAQIPIWIMIVVVLGASLSLTGALLSKFDPAMLAGSPLTSTAQAFTDYTFARNLALAAMLLALLIMRARSALAAVMTLMALIQLLDVLDDVARGAFTLAPGLLLFAIIFLIGAWQLLGWPHRTGATGQGS